MFFFGGVGGLGPGGEGGAGDVWEVCCRLAQPKIRKPQFRAPQRGFVKPPFWAPKRGFAKPQFFIAQTAILGSRMGVWVSKTLCGPSVLPCLCGPSRLCSERPNVWGGAGLVVYRFHRLILKLLHSSAAWFLNYGAFQ